MTYEQLKEYVSIILDMEKNIYVQEKTLEHMYKKRNSLGIRKEIEIPYCDKVTTDYGENMLSVGLISAVIGFLIGMFIKWGEFWDSSGIFALILTPLFGLFIALMVGIPAGLIIGPIVAICGSKNKQSEYDSAYQSKLKEYDRQKSNDDSRVKKEMILRSQVQREIDSLEAKHRESCTRLNDFYNYNIIKEKYRHNIVAIASFYEYLDEKRTFSLEFVPNTSDQGAYNIYNEEAQRGIIISQLSQVLTKLDQVMENQRAIQLTLRDANRQINYLSNNINQMSNRIESSIQEQTAIQSYNSERIQAELRFMNTMNTIYSWH